MLLKFDTYIHFKKVDKNVYVIISCVYNIFNVTEKEKWVLEGIASTRISSDAFEKLLDTVHITLIRDTMCFLIRDSSSFLSTMQTLDSVAAEFPFTSKIIATTTKPSQIASMELGCWLSLTDESTPNLG